MDGLPPPVAQVAIDSAAWTQTDRIRWPSKDAFVLVYVGASDSRTSLLRVSRDRHEFRMGQADDHLVVVLGLEPGITGGEEALDFLAAHESFHLAAQYYGSRIPFSYIEIDERVVKAYSMDERLSRIYDAVDEMHRSATGGNTSPACDELAAAIGSMEGGARTYFTYKAFWEWPAEFYAYTTAFKGSLAEYESFRSRLFADDVGYRLFTSGVKVAEMLESRLGRNAWQERAVRGESMLAMFSEAYGCGLQLDESPTLTVLNLELPAPVGH